MADPDKAALHIYSRYGVKLGRRSTVVEQEVTAKENGTREKLAHSELINKLVQENKSKRNHKFMEDGTNITDKYYDYIFFIYNLQRIKAALKQH